MKVTDLDYALENLLIKKLDIMAERCTSKKNKKDAVLIVEGSEGEGKTNSSEAIAYYIKHKTGKDVHMFFRLKPLIELAQSTEGKIIIWDEPALDSLSTDWWKETNKDLIRLLMTCRKKRHFFIFNFVKFYKFSEYVVVDRAIGLIHMYSRRSVIPGRFAYIMNKDLENLFVDYRSKKRRNYAKYRAFGGNFPLVEDRLHLMGFTIEGVENASLEDYEALKDKAIASIGRERESVNTDKIKYKELKAKIGKLNLPVHNKEELAEKLGVGRKTLYNWSQITNNPEMGDHPKVGNQSQGKGYNIMVSPGGAT